MLLSHDNLILNKGDKTWTGSARTKVSKSRRSLHTSGLLGHTVNTHVLQCNTKPNIFIEGAA
jgi:hypothetical protein